ncbi:calpain-7 [Plakobranchus ocellatus]|uniref:Calpain-7 n=1 Tax=Plakobranchus ocellatus TaxID=259542 RepID=A0AAV4AGU7_9GAST|nr:calpain-7 [Plakobranchus ocellatus]
MTKEMLQSSSQAWHRYSHALAEKKRKEREEEQNSSRKRKSDELVALKSKRKRTELDIDLLVKSADEMVEKAVKASAKEAHELIAKSLAMKNDPPPYKDGVRINSPHYLCKLVENTSDPYTLVISQYEKNNTTHYTLRVYSTVDFTLTRFPNPYKKQYEKRITGQWKGKTAGGCGNNRDTYLNNPLYQVHIDNQSTDNHLMVELLGPKQYSVGLEVISVSENVSNAPGAFQKTTSGDFRPGYCVLQLSNISGGVFNLVGHVMRREKLENLVTTGMLEGKRSRGKQREKLIEGLTDWLKAGKSLEAIEATKDRKKWRTMIANAVKQGT